MKAEEYIIEWCDKTYKGGKELGDWTTEEVMKFANDFAKKQLQLCGVVDQSKQLKCPQCGSEDVSSHSEGHICNDCKAVGWVF